MLLRALNVQLLNAVNGSINILNLMQCHDFNVL